MAQRTSQLKKSLRTTLGSDKDPIRPDQFKDGHDLTATRKVIAGDGDRGIVEAHPLAIRQVCHVKLGRYRDAHASTAGDDLDLTRSGKSAHEGRESLGRAGHVGELALQPNELRAGRRQSGGEATILLFERDEPTFESRAIIGLTHWCVPRAPPTPTCQPARPHRGAPCEPSSRS